MVIYPTRGVAPGYINVAPLGLKSKNFFIALASLQFTKPLLLLLPNYLTLIALHLILLAILGYALRRFTQHWLHSIFVEERKTAYYTAGTLVYAAIVSFILLTWNSGIESLWLL